MTPRIPAVIASDVNETLSNMTGLGSRFVQVGAPAHLAPLWFASLLRDGFALAATGDGATFAEIGAPLLRGTLSDLPLTRPMDDAVAHILAGFGQLPLHPDVAEGIRALAGVGARLVTLSNGSTAVAEALLANAGLRDHVEALLSAEEAGMWKPAPQSYAYAAATCEVEPGEILLVAVHPWDIHGAARAGLRTAWLNRTGATYPAYFAAPDYTVTRLGDLAGRLTEAPTHRP
jgi:2-haloalkanoic acid dehalogenase type II